MANKSTFFFEVFLDDGDLFSITLGEYLHFRVTVKHTCCDDAVRCDVAVRNAVVFMRRQVERGRILEQDTIRGEHEFMIP